LEAVPSLDDFVVGLRGLAASTFDERSVHDYLRDNPVEPASLAPYLNYQPTHYTRNLLFKCDVFELIMICWEVGQVSRIHNHAGQRCWMAVPIGRLAVQNYRVLRQDQTTGFCQLEEAGRVEMDPAHPTYVERELPVHSVLNPREYGARATSLHVYSAPYDRCLVYTPEKSSYCEVPLFYDTEYGRPAAGQAPGRGKD
jgi:cysteine dioxygenase